MGFLIYAALVALSYVSTLWLSSRLWPNLPHSGQDKALAAVFSLLPMALPFVLGLMLLMDALMERGLYTRVVMDCICIAPPLVTSDAVIDRIVETLRETIPSVVGAARDQLAATPA